jgi:hypothetical protein
MAPSCGETARPGKPRLLVLNVEVSGMNRYLYAALARDWDLSLFDVPRSALRDLWGKVVSFRPTLNAWRDNLDRYYERADKSAPMFRWRTKQCDRELRHRDGSYFCFPRRDVRILDIPNTSTEMLARFIAGEILSALEKRIPGARLRGLEVQVEESPGQAGIYAIRMDAAR